MNMDVLQVRNVFNGAQHLHKHQKCLKSMQDLYNQCSSDTKLLDQFKTELRRCILWTLKEEPKSPFTKHVIEFLAKFFRTFSAPEEETKADTSGDTTIIDDEAITDQSDQENKEPNELEESLDELGMESLGSESFNRSKRQSMASLNESVKEQNTFSDIVLKEHLIPFLRNVKPQIRLNCCILIRKILTDIEDVDLVVYNRLKKVLQNLIHDKDKAIRSAAALALQRFQEADDDNDPVSDALGFHLKYDPDFRVRQSCLMSLHPTAANIEHFIDATRDVKDIVRKTAFILIADKFEVKNFGIESRLQILRNGMNERHPAVKKVVEIKLLPNWIKSYNGDIVQFLYGLDIQSDPQLIERTLYLYFNHLNNSSEDNNESTAFHKFLGQFKNRFLSENNFLTKEELTVENAFLWLIVAKFCKDNETTLKVEVSSPVEEEMVDSDTPIGSQPRFETVDAIDQIIPDLPNYCNYIKVFVRQLVSTDYNENDLLEFQFMFTQLLKMGELIEVGDEAQRRVLYQSVENLLLNDQLFECINDYIPLLMKMFSKNFDLNTLVNTTLEIIDTLNSKAIESECPPPPPPIPSQPPPTETVNIEEQLRRYELEYAKLSVNVENLKDVLESAQKNGNEEESEKIQELINSLTIKMKEVIAKRLEVKAAPPPTQASQQSSQMSTQMETRTQKTLTDNAVVLERCLEIFSGCLQYGDFKSTNPSILTLMERLVMPSIANVDYFRIRNLAVKILGLVCLLGVEVAKRHFWIVIQVYQVDNCLDVRETALQCIFDILCAHGFSSFEEKSDKQKANKSISNKSLIEKSKSDIEMGSDSEDFDKTIINEGDNEILCRDSDDEEVEEESGDSLVLYFSGVMEDNLRSDCESIKFITAKGVAKLFILGRMFSPQLLSKLIIQWYDTETSEEMKQFLGAFLPIYANLQMKPNLKGENAFEECFIKTVETVFDEGLNFVNLDNMINFMLELISDDGHKILAKSVANQVLTRMLANGVDDTLCSKYYLRVLTALRLNEMTVHDIKEYKLLIKKIEKKLIKLKVKTKVMTNRLQTIRTKIDKQMDLIREKASELSPIEEFGSLSLSQSMSQSMSERSQVDDTMIGSSPTKG